MDEVFGWGLVDIASAIGGPRLLTGGQRIAFDTAFDDSSDDTWHNDLQVAGTLIKEGTGERTHTALKAGQSKVWVDNLYGRTTVKDDRSGMLDAKGRRTGQAVGLSHSSLSAKRDLGALGTSKGDTHAWSYHAAITGGTKLSAADWTIEPSMALTANTTRMDGFREKGSELSLNVRDNRATALAAKAGVKAHTTFNVADWQLEPTLSLSYVAPLNSVGSRSKADVQGHALTQESARGKHPHGALVGGLGLGFSRSEWSGALEVSNGAHLRVGYSW